MKRSFHFPLVALGIVMAAVLASLAPAMSSRVYAQAAVYYYNPYGQGVYGGYSQGYAVPYQAYGYTYQSQGGMFGNRAYGNSNYGYAPYGYGYRYDPYVRAYGGRSYYQPAYGPVYTPYGYRGY